MTELSIIIVTWNSEDEITSCVESIKRNTADIRAELIIIDNNSSDNTPSVLKRINYPNIQVYLNKENTGYTKAVNQGAGYASGDYIFLLNPDTVLADNTLKQLTDFLKNNNSYGACAPRLVNEDGTVQYSIRHFPDFRDMYFEFTLLSYFFPESSYFGRWKMKCFDYSKDTDVDQPMAAALMIQKNVLEEVNNMDERFFMFFNDVDLCRRIWETGYKIRYLSAPEIVHKKGASIYKDRIKMIKIWDKDCLKYFSKYHQNSLLLFWLKVNLKISELIRIIFYRLFHEKHKQV
jgi:GT2 family glycosyltransferase